ncbi:MAG TPA: hypothetical protein PKI61_01540 [bacterium]|nr:hypothetical protein [bacterium]HPT29676.1 hypothetical protein [bacterium]
MKKTFVWALLFVFALGLSGCGSKEKKSQENTSPNVSETFVGSLNDLLNRGEAVKCQYSKEDANGQYQGVFYIDGRNQKVRSEIEMTTKEGPMSKVMAYGIMDKEYSYSWTNMMPQGYKMKLTEAKEGVSSSSQKLDWEEKMNFACERWSLDSTKFDLPQDVTFQDFKALIPTPAVSTTTVAPSATGAGVNPTQGMDICALCNQIPDAAAKAQCQKNSCK